MHKLLTIIVLIFLGTLAVIPSCRYSSKPKLLVFSKTTGWHHTSISAGVECLNLIADEAGYRVDTTTNAELFTDSVLRNYSAVVFNNTTGNVLNNEQQAAFERFIQAGGGFVGIHAAADTEYDWPWYGKLVGAYFESHPRNPNIREAELILADTANPITRNLPKSWNRTDEWYNYKSFYPGIKVLASLNEASYVGGTNGNHHPISWHHEYDGGRSFYTGGGHTEESFSEPAFVQHLKAGIAYAVGEGIKLDYQKASAKTRPEESRFVKTVLVNNLNSPMEIAISAEGKVYFTQLFGELSLYDPKTGGLTLIHKFPVTTEGGTGLIGLALDPAFSINRHLYVYYAPGGQTIEPLHFNLSRFTLSVDNKLQLSSEKILLQVPVQKKSGSHHGGSLAWDKDGNLYLSTGDASAPFPAEGYAPLDERPGAEFYSFDAQRGPSNTNDFKGKILRIHPEPDGSYTIPPGNLFAPGTPLTKPEIFVMGVRNPYRIAVNPKTSVLYWGDIGPDAGEDSPRGPRGYDEFNQARKAGNYGWPYFIGDNQAYADWDYVTATAGPKFDPLKPVNHSPNNTGMKSLPPAVPAMIWYPYAASEKFPELGIGGRSGMVGSFYTAQKNGSPNSYPTYYDGALFVFDWMRNWMMTLHFDEKENFLRSEPFMASNGDFRRPIDLSFSNDGVMYMLEYGSVYGVANNDAQLVRIEYNRGNRPPRANATVIDSAYLQGLDKKAMLTTEYNAAVFPKVVTGTAPLEVQFSAKGSRDMDDNDVIRYQWLFDGKKVGDSSENASHIFTRPGSYLTILKVIDKEGLSAYDTVAVHVGNSRPQVNIVSTQNGSFGSAGQRFTYTIRVEDNEEKVIDPKRIKSYYLYTPEPISIDNSTVPATLLLVENNSNGRRLFTNSDCRSCHLTNAEAVGPSLEAIAARYKGKKGSIEKLGTKIIKGGGGEWGNHAMSAHPQLSQREAQEIVHYIFSLTDKKQAGIPLPIKSSIKLAFKETEPRGQYTIVSTFEDSGARGAIPLLGQDIVTIRNRTLRAVDADEHIGFPRFRDNLSPGEHKSYLAFKHIDLTGLHSLIYQYASEGMEGRIEVRLDSRAGPVIASTDFTSTGSWDTFQELNAPLLKTVTGYHDIYIIAIQKHKTTKPIVRLKDVTFN